MSTKLIQTKDYLLLIDEEAKIKPDDYILHDTVEGVIIANDEWDYRGETDDYWNKITAYYPLTKEAVELDLPLLPNPFRYVNIEELAEKWHIDNIETSNSSYNDTNSFIEGYKAAQSKQFSLEDIEKEADKFARERFQNSDKFDFISNKNNLISFVKQFIQSLSTQQLPKEFIPEYDIVHTDHAPNGFEKLLKFKINSEGKQEIKGTYKY